ncbi:V4R domain-containing protein [Balamuthia mandrillaris]
MSTEESENVKQLFVAVAAALGITEAAEVERYVQQWRKDIGLASRTLPALNTLVSNEERWKRINLDEGVKALLEEELTRRGLYALEKQNKEAPWIETLFSDEETWLQEPKIEWVEEIEQRLRGYRNGTVVPHIVRLFEGSGRLFVLLQWAIEAETRRKGRDNRMCFREDNMATSTMAYYLQTKGLTFLDEVLQPVLKPFLEQRKPSTGNKHIVKLTINLLEALCNSSESWPLDIKMVTAVVSEKLRPLFLLDAKAHFSRVICNLFFFRFILPAVINPATLPSCANIEISEEHSKVLLRASKMIQNIASEVANAADHSNDEQHDPEEEWFKAAVERTSGFITALIPVEVEKKRLSTEFRTAARQPAFTASPINADAQRGALQRLKLTVLEATRNIPGNEDKANATTCRHVRAPEFLAPLVRSTEEKVEAYFSKLACDAQTGMIRVGEEKERYLALRAEALSIDFFSTVVQTLGSRNIEEAVNFAGNLLFDLAHALGRADVRRFRKMSVYDAQECYIAGPIHFAHCGWAFVDLTDNLPSAAQSKEEMVLYYNHPFSFEADVWARAGRCHPRNPGCIMNAGYSSGWVSEVVGVDLVSVEMLCKARGDDRCHFVMAHNSTVQRRINAFIAERRQKKDQWSEKQLSSIKIPSFMESRLLASSTGNETPKQQQLPNHNSDRSRSDSDGRSNCSGPNNDDKKGGSEKRQIAAGSPSLSPHVATKPRSNTLSSASSSEEANGSPPKRKHGGNWFLKGMKKILSNRPSLSSTTSKEDLKEQFPTNEAEKNKKKAKNNNKKMKQNKKRQARKEGEAIEKNNKDLTNFLKERFNGSFKRQPQYGQVTIANTDQRCVFIRAQALSCQFFDLIQELLGDGTVASLFAANFLFDLGKSVGRSDYIRLISELSPFFQTNPINADIQLTAFKLHCAQMGFGKFTVSSLILPSFSSSSSSSTSTGSSKTPKQKLSKFYAIVEVENGFEANSWKSKWQEEEDSKHHSEEASDSHPNTKKQQEKITTKKKKKERQSAEHLSSSRHKTTCFMTSGYVCGWLQGLRVKHIKQQKEELENGIAESSNSSSEDETVDKKRRSVLRKAISEAKRTPLCAVEVSCVALGQKTCSFMVLEQNPTVCDQVEDYLQQHQRQGPPLTTNSLAMLDVLRTRCSIPKEDANKEKDLPTTLPSSSSSTDNIRGRSGSTTSSEEDGGQAAISHGEAAWLDHLFASTWE